MSLGIWESYWLDRLAAGADPSAHDATRDAFYAGAAATLLPRAGRLWREVRDYARLDKAAELAATVGLPAGSRRQVAS